MSPVYAMYCFALPCLSSSSSANPGAALPGAGSPLWNLQLIQPFSLSSLTVSATAFESRAFNTVAELSAGFDFRESGFSGLLESMPFVWLHLENDVSFLWRGKIMSPKKAFDEWCHPGDLGSWYFSLGSNCGICPRQPSWSARVWNRL